MQATHETTLGVYTYTIDDASGMVLSHRPSLAVGCPVVCEYRMGSPLQPWLGGAWIGIVEQPNSQRGAAGFNSTMSEAEYCATYGYTRVRYPFGTMLERSSSLRPASIAEQRAQQLAGDARPQYIAE